MLLEARVAGMSGSTQDALQEVEAVLPLPGRLNEAYEWAADDGKQTLLAPTWLKKLTFPGSHFRTPRLNEVIGLKYKLDKAFSGMEKPAEAGFEEIYQEVISIETRTFFSISSLSVDYFGSKFLTHRITHLMVYKNFSLK